MCMFPVSLNGRKKFISKFTLIGGTVLFFAACNTEDPDETVEAPNNNQEELNDDNLESNDDDANSVNDEENNNDGAEEGTETSILNVSTEDWEVETLADNLEIPWAMEIHDDIVYMTDREGHILQLEDGEMEQVELQTSSPIAHEGEGGLLGFVLADDFSDSLEGYAYYTFEGENGSLKNRVITVALEDDGWTETGILLDDIPGAAIHNGGRLALGSDDLLYVTTGDADDPDLSQDEESLAGKILRMTVDGEIPDENPNDDSYVYSLGHRNPQGLAWNDADDLYSSEHGPAAQDEINLIEPGNNYGWPIVEGDESEEGMEDPLIHSGDDTWAPSGVAFFEDYLLVAGLRGESLYVFDEEAEEMNVVFEGEGRLRDVKVDGQDVYILTNNTDGRGTAGDNDDRLLKLTLTE